MGFVPTDFLILQGEKSMQIKDVANQTQNEDLTEVFNLLVETLKDEETNLEQFIIRHKGQKLNPCCDPIFKAMFTDNSPEANKALKSFLSAVLRASRLFLMLSSRDGTLRVLMTNVLSIILPICSIITPLKV